MRSTEVPSARSIFHPHTAHARKVQSCTTQCNVPDRAVINATLLLSTSLAERLQSSHSVPYALQNAWIEQDIRDQVAKLSSRLEPSVKTGSILKWSCAWPVVVIHVHRSAAPALLEQLRAMPEINDPRILPCRGLGVVLD